MSHRPGMLVNAGDTRLNVVQVGTDDGYPLIVLHGGPGLDHHMFGDYLDPLAERGYRLLFVDQRGHGLSERDVDPKTLTLLKMAEDVLMLARSLGLDGYAVLGHSYGAFVALQNAVDFPGMAAQTIVSSGLPSARFLQQIERNLEAFEPVELREQVRSSWEREASADSQEAVDELLRDQMPFQFGDPRDPRIDEYMRRTSGATYAPDVLREFAQNEYGAIEVEERLGDVRHPVLVLAGRHDRTCSVAGAEAIARGIPAAELVVFEHSGHMTFVEENERYLDAVDGFLTRTRRR